MNENSFYFYSRTVKLTETREFFHGYTINETLKYNDILKNNVTKTFILPVNNRIRTKLRSILFPNEINKYMTAYNMLTLLNEAFKKIEYDKEEVMRRDFTFYFLRKNSTLRDDIVFFNQHKDYEYFFDYNAYIYPVFYGCYNNVFITDNFHEEFDYHSDLDLVRILHKANFTEGINYVIRNHIDRIENSDYSIFFAQSEYIKEILININNIISLIIDDLYTDIRIKYNFNDEAYFSQYKNYSKSYNDNEDEDDDDYYDDDDGEEEDDDDYDKDDYDDDYDDNEYGDDDYENESDDYDDNDDNDEYNESDDNIYTSYHVDSYLNFILDKNRGDFILDLSFTYYLQYSGSDIETYSYNLFEMKIKVMRDRKDVKFSMHININADEIYNKSDLVVMYKQKDKEITQVLCDYEQNIKENQFIDFHYIDASKDSRYLTQLNEIDQLVSEITPKKININFNMIV